MLFCLFIDERWSVFVVSTLLLIMSAVTVQNKYLHWTIPFVPVLQYDKMLKENLRIKGYRQTGHDVRYSLKRPLIR
jgi:hypothetical protein